MRTQFLPDSLTGNLANHGVTQKANKGISLVIGLVVSEAVVMHAGHCEMELF